MKYTCFVHCFLVFSNARHVLPQCNTRLRLLHLFKAFLYILVLCRSGNDVQLLDSSRGGFIQRICGRQNVPFTTDSIEWAEMAQYYYNMNSNFVA